MGSRRRKPKKKFDGVAKETHTPTSISAIQSPEGLHLANLKHLYGMLVRLSLNTDAVGSSGCESDICYLDVLLDNYGVKLKVKDILDLSDVLFKELDQRFAELFSALSDVSAIQLTDIWAKSEQLMLLLRCCLVILILIAFNQQLLLEKGRILLSNLSRLISIQLGCCRNEKCSITFKRSISFEGGFTASVSEEFVASISSLEHPNSCCVLICGLLEVFADELLAYKLLREYFMLIDSLSPRSEMLFSFHVGYGNIGSVLEVICAHFILSVSNEQAFQKFMNRLYWYHRQDIGIPEISLPAALSLLLSPVMLSAPKMLQAHLILLVSEAISISTVIENMILDSRSMDLYLTAFERSVILYSRHMSSLDADSHHFSGEGSLVKSWLCGSKQLTFESFILQTTKDKLYHLIAKSKDSWDSYLSKTSFRKNSDLVASSIAYMKENMCLFDDTSKDEILSILNCIILGCSSDDISGTLLPKGETSPQDIYLLASVLKLMSSSMSQIIWHLRHVGFSGYLKSKQDVSSCKVYDFIVGVICLFQQFSVHLPIQNFLCEKMQSHPARHKETKWMLLHLLGLLSLSYASGVDFLVRGCLFTMMILLYFFIIEEGDLSALDSLFISRSRSLSSKSSENVERVLVSRKCSQLISSKIQKVQDMYLRSRSITCSDQRKQNNQAETSEYVSILTGMDSTVAIADDNEETCNGEGFLKCVLGKNSKVSDFDDLADFIECKRGKDYAGWMRDKEKFRQWKCKKMISLRWKKKKKAFNSLKAR